VYNIYIYIYIGKVYVEVSLFAQNIYIRQILHYFYCTKLLLYSDRNSVGVFLLFLATIKVLIKTC